MYDTQTLFLGFVVYGRRGKGHTLTTQTKRATRAGATASGARLAPRA